MKLASSLRWSCITPLLAMGLSTSTARAEDESLIRQRLAIQTRQLKAIENAQASPAQAAEVEAAEAAAASAEVTTTNAKTSSDGLGTVGLNMARLQPATGLHSAARGLSALDDWRRIFPEKKQK